MKVEFVKFCQKAIREKKKSINLEIEAVRDSMGSDTKSSAGDKYETGREMMNQEKGKLESQLSVLDRQLETLSKIKVNEKFDKVGLGALVRTTAASYFISISYGEVKFNNESVYLISAITPLAQLLMNKRKGDKIDWNGKSIVVQSIE